MSKWQLLFVITLISLLFNGYYIFSAHKEGSLTEQVATAVPNPSSQISEFPFVSRRVFLNTAVDYLTNFKPLRKELNDHISGSGLPDQISVYFEYIPTGSSVTVREKDEIRLASLGKVQTVMAIYHKIEVGSLQKDQKVVIKPQFINQEYGSLWKKGATSSVTIEEAIRLALTESDNTAHNVLLSLISNDELNQVYDSLDIPFYKIGDFPAVSAKNYSSVLRNLYFTIYLQAEHSNEILKLLSETIYNDKLVAGVPKEVRVAHKVGMTELKDISQSSFSDCGIIYVPRRPYIACVIVRSVDQQTATQHIREISEIFYHYISSYQADK